MRGGGGGRGHSWSLEPQLALFVAKHINTEMKLIRNELPTIFFKEPRDRAIYTSNENRPQLK